MMNEQQKKILAVLDMSEEEQVEFFYIKGHRQLVDTFSPGCLRIKYDKDNNIVSVKHSQSKLRFDRRALADFAFSKRDEAVAKNHADFHEAIYDIMMKVEGCEKWATAFWGECIAKPIHWILAAEMIKAKESK